MNRLSDVIWQQVRSLQNGDVLRPKDFLRLGTRSAVDQALSRLAQKDLIVRVARGKYSAPTLNSLSARTPSAKDFYRALAESDSEIVVPDGASEAHTLGLTARVPIRDVYLTSGRSRKLKLGRSIVLIKRAPRWMLALGARPAGAAVRALGWLGPTAIGPALAKLRRTLPRAEWKALTEACKFLPDWLAQGIGEAASRATASSSKPPSSGKI
jgi:hypothetical protein